MKERFSLRRMTRLSLLLAVAMILSYVESLLPAFVAIPGIKLGLANAVTVLILYTVGAPEAVTVSLLRVLLSALLFGNVTSLAYSLSGALLSFLGMWLLRKTNRFTPVGVSVTGGVLHNAGQILTACLLFSNSGIVTLLPPLILSGTLSGILIGVLAGLLIRRLSNHI